MSIKKWEIMRKKIYQHSPYRIIEDIDYKLPDGRIQTYSLKKEGQTVSVFAVTKSNKIVLARQFRPGPDCVLDELPGGAIELNETPEQAAHRELREETGYACEKLTLLNQPYDCAYSTIKRYAFLAEGCMKVSDQALDENEFIEVVEKSINDFIQQLLVGDNTDLEIAWHGLYQLGVLQFNKEWS